MTSLTHREKHVLLMLSKGHNYNTIAQELKISRACLYQHTNNLRKKTGIKDTLDPKECSLYLNDFKPSNDPVLTPAQIKTLRSLLFGKSYAQVAKEFGLSIGTIMNTASQARQRVRLANYPGGTSGSAQRADKELRDYVRRIDQQYAAGNGIAKDPPPSPTVPDDF